VRQQLAEQQQQACSQLAAAQQAQDSRVQEVSC
jgi:hypothetical protein